MFGTTELPTKLPQDYGPLRDRHPPPWPTFRPLLCFSHGAMGPSARFRIPLNHRTCFMLFYFFICHTNELFSDSSVEREKERKRGRRERRGKKNRTQSIVINNLLFCFTNWSVWGAGMKAGGGSLRSRRFHTAFIHKSPAGPRRWIMNQTKSNNYHRGLSRSPWQIPEFTLVCYGADNKALGDSSECHTHLHLRIHRYTLACLSGDFSEDVLQHIHMHCLFFRTHYETHCNTCDKFCSTFWICVIL